MKSIIIGTSLAGKTTIIRKLRQDDSLHISEMDEKLTEINEGKFPSDPVLKHNVLAPKVISQILELEDIIFFTNTNYFTEEELAYAKEKGFVIIQLQISLDELKLRNIKRMDEEEYEDMGKWLEGMLEYQEEIKNAGLVDKIIDATQPTNEVITELLQTIKNHG